MNGDIGEPLKGQVTPFGSMVEYHSISAEDQSQSSSIWEESFAREIPRICVVCRRESGKGDIVVADL